MKINIIQQIIIIYCYEQLTLAFGELLQSDLQQTFQTKKNTSRPTAANCTIWRVETGNETPRVSSGVGYEETVWGAS